MKGYFQAKAVGKSKRERTRAALLDGGVAVIADKGFSDATVNDIARYAGLAQGTFYNHFVGRDELIITAASLIARDIDERIIEDLSAMPNGADRFIQVVDRLISDAVNAEERGAIMLLGMRRYEASADVFAELFLGHVKAAVEAGAFVTAPTDVLFRQLTALITLTIDLRMEDGAAFDANVDACEAVMRLVGHSHADAEALVRRALTNDAGPALTAPGLRASS